MSAGATPQDGALARRALLTGAAVLGAAGVASVVNAPDAGAANGDALRIGRNDNSATAPTRLTVDRPRGVTPSLDPALKVLDNRSNRDSIYGQATGGRGVVGVGGTGIQGVGNGFGGIFTGNVGADCSSVAAAGVGVQGRASGTGGVGVKGTGEGVGVDGLGSIGVYGESGRVGGKGVQGVATQVDGAASHGVYGETASLFGAGVFGKGPAIDPDLEWNATSYGVYADGAIGSSGPAFFGLPEYGAAASTDERLQRGGMTFSADFTTPSPRLIVYVKSSDGRRYKAELPLTAI